MHGGRRAPVNSRSLPPSVIAPRDCGCSSTEVSNSSSLKWLPSVPSPSSSPPSPDAGIRTRRAAAIARRCADRRASTGRSRTADRCAGRSPRRRDRRRSARRTASSLGLPISSGRASFGRRPRISSAGSPGFSPQHEQAMVGQSAGSSVYSRGHDAQQAVGFVHAKVRSARRPTTRPALPPSPRNPRSRPCSENLWMRGAARMPAP